MSKPNRVPRTNIDEDRQALSDRYQRKQAPLPRPPQVLERAPRQTDEQLGVIDGRRRVTTPPAPVQRSPRAAPPVPKHAHGVAVPPVARTAAALQEAELLDLLERPPRPMPQLRGMPLEQVDRHPWLLVPIMLLLIAIILVASPGQGESILSTFRNGITAAPAPAAPAPAAQAPAGEHSLLLNGQPPSIDAALVDAVLADYGSPATGTGQVWVDLGMRYGIDPAYALAFFIHESSAGTHPNWAGLKPGGGTTHNVGNIICAGYPTCYGRFRDYGSWEEGIEDWYRLIAREYVEGRGVHTIEQIIPIYAPSVENNVPAYVQAVVSMVNEWRTQGGS